MSVNAHSHTQKIHDHQAIFRCPICAQSMQLVDSKSLVCANRHCFDLAKHGYVNFLNRAVKSKYNKPLFEARRQLAQSGFFESLNQVISRQIIEEYTLKQRQLKLLDAGCGEGSHLARIVTLVNRQTVGDHNENKVPGKQDIKKSPFGLDIAARDSELLSEAGDIIAGQILADEILFGVGMDLAKEGVMIAAKEHRNALWCVADLAHCPFNDQQFDIILNILSPSNYSEFQRLLTEDGLVIKVIPERDYLRQLREIIYERTARQNYSNDKTLELFEQNLNLVASKRVHYALSLEQPLIEHLVHMTPLTWRADAERIQKILDLERLEITVDLTMLVGRRKSPRP